MSRATESLPAGVTFVSAFPPTSTGPIPLVWNVGILNASETWMAAVAVRVDLGFTGWLTNVVQATTGAGATVTDAVVSQVQGTPALEVTKYATPDPVPAGELLTYTIVVTNGTASAMSNVVVTDSLPAGVAFISALPPASIGPTSLIWNLGNMPPATA